jgi:hypothetical protein
MIIVIGLVILVAAVIAGVAGVLSNGGSGRLIQTRLGAQARMRLHVHLDLRSPPSIP